MDGGSSSSAVTAPTPTTCPYCGVGCGLLASKDNNSRIAITGDPAHPANFGRLCSKGSALAETIDLEGRLLQPMIGGRPVDWDAALDRVASGFKQAIERHGPDSVAFYVSGQLLTEDYYAANKLMKGFIGSANIDTNSRLCMASAVAAHKRAFGSDTVPCSYEDLELADLIVITGSNLAWCHPVIYQRIEQARKKRPHMKIIVIDPRRTATAELADLHLAIKPGTDAWLFNGLLNHMRREDGFDFEFLIQHTEGFAAAVKSARASSGTIPEVAGVCHLPESGVAEFFRLFTNTERAVTLFSQGINQSSSGTDKANSIINCHLASGRIGRPGMGPFSITGQPNAMGGREVGALANQLAAHMEIGNPEHRMIVQSFWRSPALPAGHGLKAMDLFRAIGRGEIKAVWIMATNPMVSLPDINTMRAALEQCPLVVVSDCIQNTDTTGMADVLLPALAWGEKDGTVTNSERRISRQRAFLPQPGEAKPDWWIISGVAGRMGFADQFPYRRPVEIFREHAALSGYMNHGARSFDISGLAGIEDREYETLQPLQWPLTDTTHNTGTPGRPFAGGRFLHPGGKARIIAIRPRPPKHLPDEAHPLILNSGRARDHWHTMTRTGKSPRLSAHTIEPVAELHPDDAARCQLQDRQLVMVKSRWGETIARVCLTVTQRPGSIYLPMHWNRQYSSGGLIGAVVNPVSDPLSGQPESKHTPVRIEPFRTAWQGYLLSRIPLDMSTVEYWTKAIGHGHWGYEIAGTIKPGSWKDFARSLLDRGQIGNDWIEYADPRAGCYRTAAIRDGRLQACLFIAPTMDQLPSRSWLKELFNDEKLNTRDRISLLAGKRADGRPDDGPTVCACFNVGRDAILSAVDKEKITSVEGIGKRLHAGTNCGACIPELKILLQQQNPVINAA